MAQLKKENSTILELIKELPEPVESDEIRINIETGDFKTYGESIIKTLQIFSEKQDGWEVVPNKRYIYYEL